MSDHAEDEQNGDDDLDYQADARGLRTAALIMRRRAALLARDAAAAELAAELEDYAADYADFAALLDAQAGEAAPDNNAEDAEEFSPPETILESASLVGLEQRSRLRSTGAELRRFKLIDKTGAESGAVAMAELLRLADGSWETLHLEVHPDHRRRGLATLLYDAIEQTLATTLRPSGWLSEDGYAFWRARRAGSVDGHRRMEPFLRLWISPAQLLNLLVIDRSKIEALLALDAAHGRRRLH
jgi:GNAT superfamily N-acetyltransferase